MTESIASRLNAEWAPPSPQLLRNARMTSLSYEASEDGIRALLPRGLKPHPDHRVHANMYEVGAGQTSGFGPFSITYLAVEIADHDSDLAEGDGKLPGRYFAFYWNSSARVRAYARECVGVKAAPGERRLEHNDGKLISILRTGGRDVIRATINATENSTGTVGGHLNYYSKRTLSSPDGGKNIVDELLEFPLPFIADTFDATVENIQFDFPEGHPAALLTPTGSPGTAQIMYMDATFTYSMGRQIESYL